VVVIIVKPIRVIKTAMAVLMWHVVVIIVGAVGVNPFLAVREYGIVNSIVVTMPHQVATRVRFL
jgi:hypothetical protein